MRTENNNTKDSMGDLLKAREHAEAGRKADPHKPLIARLDGRAFHTFTAGLKRPYDERFSELMQATTAYLVEKTNAIVGYTQSDEITLVWNNKIGDDGILNANEYLFDGKYQKLVSVLAGMASAFFCKHLPLLIPEKAEAIPHFDCRVWNVSDLDEAFANLLWRQDDAIKNSISMAAQACFSHKQLHGVGSEAKKQMLRDLGKPWENEPEFFKWGSFFKKTTHLVELIPEQLSKIPEQHRPTGPVPRSIVKRVDIGYIRNEDNIIERLLS